MSEPTNPLFEQEKAFLERKKLEYERALRGDVAQLKQQTADAGRVALVAGGLAGSVWLITKLFTSRKRRPSATDDHEQYESFDYRTDGYDNESDFGADDYAADDYRPASDARWADADDYFGGGAEHESHGTVYHTDTNSYDDPAGNTGNSYDDSDLDDNGLHNYPDFPEHSSHDHGTDAPAQEAEHFESEAYGHPESTLPFDDSRRLPESSEFTEEASEPAESEHEAGPISQHTARYRAQQAQRTPPKRNLGAMLLGLAKTDIGKVVVGQAASLAIGLVTSQIKKHLPSDAPETAKSSDLAASTGENDGYAHGHPATPQPDAHHTSADAFTS